MDAASAARHLSPTKGASSSGWSRTRAYGSLSCARSMQPGSTCRIRSSRRCARRLSRGTCRASSRRSSAQDRFIDLAGAVSDGCGLFHVHIRTEGAPHGAPRHIRRPHGHGHLPHGEGWKEPEWLRTKPGKRRIRKRSPERAAPLAGVGRRGQLIRSAYTDSRTGRAVPCPFHS
jgi:hypothetical protein